MSHSDRSRDGLPSETEMDDVIEQLDELEQTVDSAEELRELNDVRIALERLPGGEFVEKRIEKYTTRDVAESFVGSILVSLPLLVEDGVFDIADHFVGNTAAGIPFWLVGNVVFVTLVTWALLYWADFRVIAESDSVFGLIPYRVVGVLLISFSTATLLMTLWGRLGGWNDPLLAFARIAVVWTAAAFGAALGDILPGQSGGTEVKNVPEELSETFRSDE